MDDLRWEKITKISSLDLIPYIPGRVTRFPPDVSRIIHSNNRQLSFAFFIMWNFKDNVLFFHLDMFVKTVRPGHNT